MRAIVISDSHRDSASVNMVLNRHRNADLFIFLGDGEDDFFSAENMRLTAGKKVIAVCGNCDYLSTLPKQEIFTFGGKKIYALHGHTKSVKYGTQMLEAAAQEIKADIAVYGHTHEEKVEYINGIYYMCPGSIRDGCYGIIDIDDKTGSAICYTAML